MLRYVDNTIKAIHKVNATYTIQPASSNKNQQPKSTTNTNKQKQQAIQPNKYNVK